MTAIANVVIRSTVYAKAFITVPPFKIAAPLNVIRPNSYTYDYAYTYTLHRAWSLDNNAFVFWQDSVVNLSPSVTIPASVVGNLVNKCVMM